MIEIPQIRKEDDLFLFLIHVISERFKEHAILKGGMVLRLLGSNRRTLDLDYTFVPYLSKKDVLGEVRELFSDISGLNYKITTNSKAIRVNIEVGNLRSQVEINVAQEMKTDVMSTASLKNPDNSISPRIVKIMSLDVALSHKLAAWNERRLLRDLYDVYYFLEVQNIYPDLSVLKNRLTHIESRRPELKKVKSMSFESFLEVLTLYLSNLKQEEVEKELDGLLGPTEIAGLSYRMKDVITRLIHKGISSKL